MTNVQPYYDDQIHWAFTSAQTEASNQIEGSTIDISTEESLAFIDGMELVLNDGSNSKSLVTFKETIHNTNTGAQCKVVNKS